MSDTLDKLEAAVTGKDENAMIDITINNTNAQRVIFVKITRLNLAEISLMISKQISNPNSLIQLLEYSKHPLNMMQTFYISP